MGMHRFTLVYIGVRGFPARGYFIPGRDGGSLVAGNSSVSSWWLSRDRARARPYGCPSDPYGCILTHLRMPVGPIQMHTDFRRTHTDAYGCPSDTYGSIWMPVGPIRMHADARRTYTDPYGCPSDPYGCIRMPVGPIRMHMDAHRTHTDPYGCPSGRVRAGTPQI